MRFKESPQLPGAGRTRAWHHHGCHTPTSPGSILLCTYLAMSHQTFPPPVYPERGQKQTFFDPFSPHLDHVVIEWPLSLYMVGQHLTQKNVLVLNGNQKAVI